MNNAVKTIALIAMLGMTTACSTTKGEQRVLTGTAIGAGAGALVGAAAGNAAVGAVAGGILGAGGGYLYHKGKK